MPRNSTALKVLLKDFPAVNNDDPIISRNCKKIQEGIKSGKFAILDLIEQLEELLIHYLPTKRELGVEILTQVIEKLDDGDLTSEQLNVIALFYTEKIKDNHQVLPSAIRGILALVQFKNLPEGRTAEMLNSIFLNVPCQQQQYDERKNIYQICQISFERRKQEMIEMGADFVFGVISAMEGERDPRNLMLLFNWLPQFFKAINFVHFNEDMFETIACYFPVDFMPMPEKKNMITREMLAEGLCRCLTAVPYFGEFCMPLAMEKLDSSLRNAKLDSLKVLKEGCKTFDVTHYQENSVNLWSLIYKELLQSSGDFELETACLETLKAYLAKLSSDDENSFKHHLKNIIDTTKGNLLPDANLFEITSKIVLNLTQASPQSAQFTTKEVLPILTNTYSITNTPSHKVKLLRILVAFYQVLNETLAESDEINVTKELKEISNLCVLALFHADREMRITALHSIGLLELDDILKDDIFRYILDTSLEDLETGVKEAFHFCFKTIAIKYSDEFERCIIRKVEVKNLIDLKCFIEALTGIATHRRFIGVVLPILMRYCLGSVDEAEVGFNCLRAVLEKHERNSDILNYMTGSLDAIKNIIYWALARDIKEKRQIQEDILVVLKILVGSLNQQEQIDLLKTEIDQIIIANKNNITYYVVLLHGLIVRLHKEIPINPEIIATIFDTIFEKHPDHINDVTVQLFANILNKIENDDILDQYLARILDKYNGETNKTVIIRVITWTTKALLIRNHKETNFWIEKCLELIEKHEEATTILKTIMRECDALSAESYCQMTLLYRQKFFMFISNKLNELHPNIHSNFLVAFGLLLQETPHQILLTSVEKVFKTLILCMDNCKTSEALCCICQSFLLLIQHGHHLITNYLTDLLPRFLNLAVFKPSMKVRVAALKCLGEVTKANYLHKLVPHKQYVISELGVCLDDPKRLVRQEAVDARLKWYLLGTS